MKVSNVDEAVSRAKRSLERYLKGQGVQIEATADKSRSAFMLIAGIETHLGDWATTKDAWLSLSDSTGIEKHFKGDPVAISGMTEAELEVLARLAISSPGVVLGRAVRRHWNKALSDDNFKHLVNASWSGLRTRFDAPWISRALRGPKETFPAAIKRAVRDGNLEATSMSIFGF
jgi:hypothetical protein